jgi:hypothetical protein
MFPGPPKTKSGELAAVVPTVPAPREVHVTDAAELRRREEEADRREALVERKALRSRIAEIVALTVVIMSALAEIARGIASMLGGHQ